MNLIGAYIRVALRRRMVWIPLAMLAGITLIFWTTELDIVLVRPFFSGYVYGSVAAQQFPLGQMQPWKWLYDWGTVPALVLGGAGMAAWVVSFSSRRMLKWREPGLFLALMLLVGPGLIVNVLGKPCWERPRPSATKAFGGPNDYVPVWHFGCDASAASFPSGHTATAFCMIAPAFFYLRRRPWLAAAWIVVGLTCGGTVGLARIVAGGHFPSDVLWTGGIIYFTGLALAAAFGFNRLPDDEPVLISITDYMPSFEESGLAAAA